MTKIHSLLSAHPNVVANLNRMSQSAEAVATSEPTQVALAVRRSGLEPDKIKGAIQRLRGELVELSVGCLSKSDPAIADMLSQAAAAEAFLAALTCKGPSREHSQDLSDASSHLESVLQPGVSERAPVYRALGDDYIALNSLASLRTAHAAAEAFRNTSADGILDPGELKEAIELLSAHAQEARGRILNVLYGNAIVSDAFPKNEVFTIAPELRGLDMAQLMKRTAELIRGKSALGAQLGSPQLLKALDPGDPVSFADTWRRKTDEPINALISGLVEAQHL